MVAKLAIYFFCVVAPAAFIMEYAGLLDEPMTFWRSVGVAAIGATLLSIAMRLAD